jgi:hypothetical protein
MPSVHLGRGVVSLSGLPSPKSLGLRCVQNGSSASVSKEHPCPTFYTRATLGLPRLKPGDQEFTLKMKFDRQILMKLDEELILGNRFLSPVSDVNSKCLLKL